MREHPGPDPLPKCKLYFNGVAICMDIIFLDDVRLPTWIGVYDWERQAPQILELSLEIGLPDKDAGHSDKLSDTIDYEAVIMRLTADLAEQHFLLLEALAEHVAEVILHDFGAPWLKLKVVKPGVMRGVRKVGVMIERRREELSRA